MRDGNGYTSMMSRDTWLAATDDALLADCEIDRFRASGPGGQKRNKTESAVRLRHRSSGLAATATESRSQHENKQSAVRRLRAKLAIELRDPVTEATRQAAADFLEAPPRKSEKARRSLDYLGGIAALLDLVAAADWAVGEAARELGVTTGALVKAVTADERVLRHVNQERARLELKPLRA